MAVQLQQQNLIPRCRNPVSLLRRTSNSYYLHKVVRPQFFCKGVFEVWSKNSLGNLKRRCYLGHELSDIEKHTLSCKWLEFRKHHPPFFQHRRMARFFLLASTDDSIAVNGAPQVSSTNDLDEGKVKRNQPLQGEDIGNGLIQALHDAARVFELSIKERGLLSKNFWFSKTWLGEDRNAWVKTVSYQAAVHSLLQAASEVSERGDGWDRDVSIFVQRSLLRQSATLETLVRDELSTKQPETHEWFWSEQHPVVVTTFLNYLEKDPCFTAASAIYWQEPLSNSGKANDVSLIILALSCIAAITKLGPAKVSCPQFFSAIPDTTGRLMDKLIDFVPIRQAFYSMKDISLHREFLVHFGPRAAYCGVKNDLDTEEIAFWVELIQQQLQRAIDKEKIWSRLTTSESIEVLDKDLAIFGFFIALGRSTQSFLSTNGFNTIDEPIESFIRYLIGGSVLYYPQLSTISSYQLYVEVVCEELDWLPFYSHNSGFFKKSHESKENEEMLPNHEAVPKVLDVCSYWMQSFIKYSTWLENPSNIKAAKFLSRGHKKLRECREEVGLLKSGVTGNSTGCHPGSSFEVGTSSSTERELDSFDEALESIDEALKRLEELLQEIHVSSSDTQKEHLKAACSDLERIRKLKKEAEFLEASFRAKAASLQQGDSENMPVSLISKKRKYSKRKTGNGSSAVSVDSYDGDRSPSDRVAGNSNGLWRLFVPSTKKVEPGLRRADQKKDEPHKQIQQATSFNAGVSDSQSEEIHRFAVLRRELLELERRVHRSTDGNQYEENNLEGDSLDYDPAEEAETQVQLLKKEGFIGKSIEKLKETSTDVWQGTQLLAIDVAAAAGLLRRIVIGDELTGKEKKALQRTLVDIASVVPIGILMLLPVTAVGHAAILAAIQRYVPALIPSAYAPERLDLLRQLEKMKEIDMEEIKFDDNSESDSLKLRNESDL